LNCDGVEGPFAATIKERWPPHDMIVKHHSNHDGIKATRAILTKPSDVGRDKSGDNIGCQRHLL